MHILINCRTLIASHKFEKERYQWKRNVLWLFRFIEELRCPDECSKTETFNVGKYFYK